VEYVEGGGHELAQFIPEIREPEESRVGEKNQRSEGRGEPPNGFRRAPLGDHWIALF
jgi:hypothetical protein